MPPGLVFWGRRRACPLTCPPQIAVQNPLVSERLELSVLYKEYAEDDNIYQQKIKVGAQRAGREHGGGSRSRSTLGLAS